MTAVVMLFSITTVNVTLAERYPGENESVQQGAQIRNYLREDCWERDGSFMYYTEEGFRSVSGVDVSKWNGDIDWEELALEGISFAIIRLGFRGYEYGDLVLDERFHEYMEGAALAGIKTGVYFYSQAIDEEEAEEEAYFVMEHLAGYQLDLPVYFDTEEVRSGEARTDMLAIATYTKMAEVFCETLEENGYRAGVYASNEWIRKNLDLSRLSDYEIWYALYSDTPGREYGFDMWQYSQNGKLNGCETSLDMNIRVERE